MSQNLLAESQLQAAQLAFAILQPPPERTADLWSEQARRQLPPGSAEAGQIRVTRTPYVVPIARAHAIWGLRQITYVMARQMAKTQGVIFAEIGRRLDDCPTPIMYVGTTELFIRDKVEPKIVHLLQSTPSLNRKTSWGHGSSKYSKVVAGVRLKLAWAGSDSM
ncbi:phage terminase large subunit family protein, partial [uncultured Thiodictyon sp.]|uniref:phage terminase large subunit family protein n=1 Tax=uncultured Thiodictyon sp. TaxID=1846217 RepID=UPI0025E4F9B6